MSLDHLRVAPRARPDLSRFACDDDLGWHKAEAKAELARVQARLDELQTRLYADGRSAVLVVVQAMDAAGKDGVVRNVFGGLNPAGVKVTSFKAPAGRELKQDFLWRCHANAPMRGDIAVWNRSHYEDVLVVRVHDLVAPARWRRRYRHIREFERVLADEGTRVVKFFLHVSRQEQLARLQDRQENPKEFWKFNQADLAERERWDDYMEAYAVAMKETSTARAPWYVIPADRRWARNLAVAKILERTLERIDPRFPARPPPG